MPGSSLTTPSPTVAQCIDCGTIFGDTVVPESILNEFAHDTGQKPLACCQSPDESPIERPTRSPVVTPSPTGATPEEVTTTLSPTVRALTPVPTTALDDGNFGVIPIRFDISGLSEEPVFIELGAEMMTVLKRTLMRADGDIEELRIVNVEEDATYDKDYEDDVAPITEAKFHYKVYVVRDEDRRFGPIIIQYIHDNYDDVIYEIQ